MTGYRLQSEEGGLRGPMMGRGDGFRHMGKAGREAWKRPPGGRSRSVARLAVPALLLWPWAAAAQTADGATPLEWISGCWEMRSERSTTVERWGDAVGGLLLGTSKTTRGEQVAAWELLRIEASDDGMLTYWAYPSGQSPTTFTAQGSSPDSVTFSNPEHDFPRSVTYRRRPDSLVASIQGETSGGFRQIFFPFTRVPCEG